MIYDFVLKLWLKLKLFKFFIKSFFFFRLPYLYNDAVAGITVALMLLPQALAYAHVARLHPQFGLYSSFMGCFVYFFLGTSKDITLGPTALMSLLTAEFCSDAGANSFVYAIVLCLMTGCAQLFLGIMHLGESENGAGISLWY